MHKHAAAEMGNLGQIRDTKPKMGKMGVPGELLFFLGHIIKNRDCPRKSGTDADITLHSITESVSRDVFVTLWFINLSWLSRLVMQVSYSQMAG